ncbi:putative 4-hydroxybenzoyl-CoA reductase subunit beta [Syntrophobacter sp. SbD1]|nr:putative 4-hydroxybenzoyl-CoA reductase subunit beta [Syntrophobacter sp. SbD1]
MRLPKFEYIEPTGLKEASSILIKEGGARILAGGTDMLVNMKHRVDLPSLIVNIKKIPGLDSIRKENGTLKIGALTPLKQVSVNPDVLKFAPGLAQAASSVGSYHHQTMGTIGGNICQQNRCKYFNQSKWWRSSRELCFKAGGETCYVVNKKDICYSSYCGDMAPALLTMNAKVKLVDAQGAREVLLESIFSGDGKNPLNLKKGEILTEFVLPEDSMKGISIYRKTANRESIDFPIVGAALWASKESGSLRIAFTAVDRKPVVVQGALLTNKVEDIMELASKSARPVNNSVYSASYKKKMMGMLVKSMLGELN